MTERDWMSTILLHFLNHALSWRLRDLHCFLGCEMFTFSNLGKEKDCPSELNAQIGYIIMVKYRSVYIPSD